jgi:hypothetical protein
MARYEAVTIVQASADEIWTYAADIRHHPDWMSATDPRIDRGTGLEQGDRGRERLALGPLKLDMAFEVSQSEPGRRIAWRAVDDPSLDWEVSLELEPIDPTSTRATYRATVGLRGRWRLIAPLVAMEGQGGVKRELQQLKAIVEQRSPTPTGAAAS